MKNDFNELIHRENTGCHQYDLREKYFGTEDVIPMWVADMDFRSPGVIREVMKRRLDHGVFGYTYRTDGFYNSVINWVKLMHGWDIKKEWIDFSPGVVPALNMAILAYTAPGDKVIVQQPVYYPFFSAITNHNRILVNNPLKLKDGRYYMDLSDLKSKIDDRVRMIFLCSPHNPTGNVWTREELSELADICTQNNILIISDEIHSDLFFSEHKHIPTASLDEETAKNTVTFISPSKSFNLAGLSTSVVISSNESLIGKYRRTLDHLHVGGGNIFGNIALEAAYNHGHEWLTQLMDYLHKNLDYLTNFLTDNIPVIRPVKPEATYLVWLDCRELGMEPSRLKRFFIEKAKLGLSDGLLFGEEGAGFQRMNIACPQDKLKIALKRLEKAINKN